MTTPCFFSIFWTNLGIHLPLAVLRHAKLTDFGLAKVQQCKMADVKDE